MRRLAPLLLTFGLGLGILLSASTAAGSDPRGANARWDLVQIAEGVVLPGGADVAAAANGETLTLTGSGHAEPLHNQAFGGGTFVRKDAGGSVLGQGIYFVTGLVSWRPISSGSLVGTGLIDGIGRLRKATSGIMKLDVHFIASGGSPQFDGLLTVFCHLPGTIPTFPEGITVSIPGLGLNFNTSASGITLFHFVGVPEA